MHYVAGESLQARINRIGALEIKEILRIGIQVADGLAAAHEQGLVHRDIKPSNILLEETNVERALITDFGLARAADDVQVTRTGTYMGTPQYMSPEQTRGEPVNHLSDLFSLGSVLFSMSTGRAAFAGDSPFVVMKKIGEEPTPNIQQLNPDLPSWLNRVIQKLHTKLPADRYQNAAEVRELLKCCLNHLNHPEETRLPASLTVKPTQLKPKKDSRKIVATILTLAVVVSALVLSLYPQLLSLSTSPDDKALTEHSTAPVIDEPISEGNEPPAPPEAETPEALGFGFSRLGQNILFDGVSISNSNARYKSFSNEFMIRKFKLPASLADSIDPQSFRALSSIYAKDKNEVYFKHSFRTGFLLLKLPQADSSSFEIETEHMAKDKSHVWYRKEIIEGIDPGTLKVIHEDFVWKDANHVWYKQHIIEDADPRTFQYLGNNYYKDSRRVFWASSPIEGADPLTFRLFQLDLPYGRDRNAVWYTNKLIENVDVDTFDAIHQGVYKDESAVYIDSIPLKNADPKSFGRLAELDAGNVLLSDGKSHYVFFGVAFGIHQVWLEENGNLSVRSRILDRSAHPPHAVGHVQTTLTTDGWEGFQVIAPEEHQRHSPKFYELFEQYFKAAKEILSKKIEKPLPKKLVPIQPCPWPNGQAPKSRKQII